VRQLDCAIALLAKHQVRGVRICPPTEASGPTADAAQHDEGSASAITSAPSTSMVADDVLGADMRRGRKRLGGDIARRKGGHVERPKGRSESLFDAAAAMMAGSGRSGPSSNIRRLGRDAAAVFIGRAGVNGARAPRLLVGRGY
jgi:hypothetical protein